MSRPQYGYNVYKRWQISGLIASSSFSLSLTATLSFWQNVQWAGVSLSSLGSQTYKMQSSFTTGPLSEQPDLVLSFFFLHRFFAGCQCTTLESSALASDKADVHSSLLQSLFSCVPLSCLGLDLRCTGTHCDERDWNSALSSCLITWGPDHFLCIWSILSFVYLCIFEFVQCSGLTSSLSSSR